MKGFVILVALALVAGCAKKSQTGESCTETSDCAGDLRCVGQVCVAAGGESEPAKAMAGREDCRAAGANYASVEGVGGELAEGVADKFVEDCVGKIWQSEALCIAEAGSMQEVTDCEEE